MFERFTPSARNAVIAAYQSARELGHSSVGPEHLLLGVMQQPDSVGGRVLRSLGVQPDAVRAASFGFQETDSDALKAIGIDLEAVRRSVEATFGPGALDRTPRTTARLLGRTRGRRPSFNKEAKAALQRALPEARLLQHTYLGTEHLLLGIASDDQNTACRALRQLGTPLNQEELRARVLAELGRAA
jgi:ATP-dependent Clp protease ATP-binding subunit ClpA